MIYNLSERKINALDRKLLKIVKENYPAGADLYAETETLTHAYCEDGQSTLHIHFGFIRADGNKVYHTLDIIVCSKKLDFIAGQFQEALIRENF